MNKLKQWYSKISPQFKHDVKHVLVIFFVTFFATAQIMLPNLLNDLLELVKEVFNTGSASVDTVNTTKSLALSLMVAASAAGFRASKYAIKGYLPSWFKSLKAWAKNKLAKELSPKDLDKIIKLINDNPAIKD